MTVDLTAYVHRDDGLDGSHYQPDAGPMDLAAVRGIPTNWLGWKTTQSTAGIDPSFPEVDTVAVTLGFRWFLPYGWLSSTTDPHAQADHYLAHCGKIRAGKGAMIDAEEKGITVAKCLAWLERTEDEFKRPSSVYTGLYVAGGTIWRSPEIRMSKYGRRPMHLAAYITAQGLVVRLQSLGITELQIHAWQWTSNGILTTGVQMPGITGRADINTIVTPSMMDLACGVTPTPPPSEDDMLELITNDIYPNPGYSVWALMDDGTKRGVSPAEYTARGVRVPRIVSDADLALIPDYVAGGFNPAVLNALNDAVGRLGQNQGSAALELERAAAALKGV